MVKNTAPKTKPLISKENAQNRPETIQRGQGLGVSAFREQIGNSARIALHLTPTHFRIVPIMYHVKNRYFLYSLLTKAKIYDISCFSNMGGELKKGHCGGNYV